MSIQTPAFLATEATLFCRKPVQFDPVEIRARFDAARGPDAVPARLRGMAEAESLVLEAQGCQIMFSAARRRLASAPFRDALASPILADRRGRFSEAIRTHLAHVRVLVTAPTGSDLPPLVVRIAVLKAALDTVCALEEATLVHCLPGNMLLDPAELREARDAALLAFRPDPVPGDMAHEVGLRATGSHHLLGRTLVLAPAPRALDASIALAARIIETHSGELPRHGSEIETEDGETLYARHDAPDAADPAGRVVFSSLPPTAPAQVLPQRVQPKAAATPVSEILSPDLGVITIDDPENDPRLHLVQTIPASNEQNLARRAALPVLLLAGLLLASELPFGSLIP